MRKLLLGGTAVAAAALFGPNGALAQGADPFRAGGPPMLSHRELEVRVGGYFRSYYGYTRQDGNRGGIPTATGPYGTPGVILGKSDFSHEAEIHVIANGKAANGLRYGVAIEVQNDNTRTPIPGQVGKRNLDLDEAWGFLQGPFGQIRFGDEDAALSFLGTGYITGFGTGGLDGDRTDFIVGPGLRPSFNQAFDLGDSTKIIYLTPQFLGFDAGVSFAFNFGQGPLTGCDSPVAGCDVTSAIPGGIARRRNELSAMLRWRGTFGAFGGAAHVGYLGADGVRNTIGPSPQRMNVGLVGAQATAFGFTFGGNYTFGRANAGFAPIFRGGDDRNLASWMVGATYTIDAFTVGAHYVRSRSAGSQVATTGARVDQGWAVGGTYRLAPGIEARLEYTRVERRENGFDFFAGAANPVGPTFNRNSRNDSDVVLAGFNIAF